LYLFARDADAPLSPYTPLFRSLAGQRLAVLQTGITDRLDGQARGPGDAARGLLGVQVALLDPQPQMLAAATERNIQHLVDLEVLGGFLEYRLPAGLALGARPQQFGFGHSGSSSTTACTAMPSSRPTKPSVSVVVALTLTWSGSARRSSAMHARMAWMCGAIFGAWARMVRSTLPTRQPFPR